MPTEDRIPTTQETGGAGTTYEHHVGASFLARLLMGGLSPVFANSRLRIEKVAFQTRRLGWETDDLLIICSSEGMEQKNLAIQSKRNFVLQERNTECVKTFLAFWSDFTNEDIFDRDKDALALSTLPSSKALSSGLRDLFHYARSSSDENDFQNRLSRMANETIRGYCKTIKSIIQNRVSSEITDREFWCFLSTIHLLNLDLQTDTSTEEATIKTMLTVALREPGDLSIPDNTWSDLIVIAANSASDGRTYSLADLPKAVREPYRVGNFSELGRNLERISELTERYIQSNPSLDIGGRRVARAEVSELFGTFDDGERGNFALVSGRSGVGKTSLISQTMLEAEKRGWSILALRADRLPASPTPAELGDSLGLTKSPVHALADVAGGEGCFLVIDQMDALSLASRNNPDYIDCINGILEQAKGYPNMNVLIACRRFDMEDNRKLWEVIDAAEIEQEVTVEPFDKETVKSLVADLGISPETLSARQLELLSLPVHLKMLEFILSVNQLVAMNFESEAHLYDAFWQEKRRGLSDRLESFGRDGSLINSARDTIVEIMNDRQSLFAPAAMLEQFDDVISLMVSENILVKDGSRVSFFHDSFFDYMFALWFTSKDLNLATFILERDQSLFMRSQVNRVLIQQRSESERDFRGSLESILTNEDIRTHLKSNVLSLLGTIDDPMKQEWSVIEPLIGTELTDHVLRLIRGSVGWFDLLSSIGVLESWMAGADDGSRNAAVHTLQQIQRQRSQQVAEMLTPYIGKSDFWDNAIFDVISLSTFTASREYFEFVCAAVRAGVFDKSLLPSNNNADVWFYIERFVDECSAWACEFIASCIDRMNEITKHGDSTELLPRVGYSTGRQVRTLTVAATKDPQKFIDLLLPRILTLIRSSIDSNGMSSFGRRFLHFSDSKDFYDIDDALVSALDSAMSLLAEKDPDAFSEHAVQLRPLNYPVVQCLLTKGYAANGDRFADEAVDYLLEDTERLAVGSGNQKYWIARHTIESASGHCSDQNFQRLERAVLEFYPDYELEAENSEYKGSAQGILLGGMDSQRLSPDGLDRLHELQDKFGVLISQQQGGIEGGFVGSPISEEDARKMTDEEWLNAIATYSSDSPSRNPEEFLKGGARQLAGVLENLVKEDPLRFSSLAHRIPDNAKLAYFEAILRGITDVDLDKNVVVEVCMRCHRIPGQPLGRWITRPLRRLSAYSLPNEALEMVAWYATEDPDPHSTQPATSRQLDHIGLNSVRGAAALSVAKLISKNPEHFPFFAPYLEKMVNDSSDAVRGFVAKALISVLDQNSDLAIELFIKLCDTDDRLLATRYVKRFLEAAIRTHFTHLEPVFRRMLDSHDETVATSGARLACFASLIVPEAQRLASGCMAGTKPHRLGAAEIYALNLKLTKHKAVCEDELTKLFSDPDSEVRRTAAGCFFDFEGRDLGNYQDLIKEFILSPAFEAEHDPLFWALEKSSADVNGVILMACERVFELMGESTGDVRTAAAGTSNSIAKLIARVLEDPKNDDEKNRGLNIIDEMERYGAYGLDEIRRRFDR